MKFKKLDFAAFTNNVLLDNQLRALRGGVTSCRQRETDFQDECGNTHFRNGDSETDTCN